MELVRLRPAQLPLLAAHLLRLDDEDRYLRFGSVATDASIRAWVGALRPSKDEVIVTMVGAGSDTRVTAAVVGRHYLANGGAVCDVSISVDAGYRRAGIATALLGAMMRSAKHHHVVELRFDVLQQNRVMINVARKVGAVQTARGDWAAPTGADALANESMVSVDGVQHLSVGAANAPGVYCVHGSGGHAWQFRSAARELTRAGWRMMAPIIDPLSAGVSGADSMESYAARLRSALTQLTKRPPLAIAGHSLGAVIATHVADQLDASRLVLLNPMPLDGLSAIEALSSTAALSCRHSAAILSSHANYQALPHRRRSVRLLVGASDRVSSLDYALRSARRCLNSVAAIRVTQTGHLGFRHMSDLFEGVMVGRG